MSPQGHEPPPGPGGIGAVAREKFGYESLRPGQTEAIEAVLSGRDALVVMPTGSGKSAIYQIAALLIPGPTIVVSPLLALQRDQLESIEARDLAVAAAVNSTIKASERREALRDLRRDLEFLFLAPEQFSDESLLARLSSAAPSLFVVDEAHCISHWGHDFRPDYLRLGSVARALGRPPILALTATASVPVREEIVRRLEMRNPAVIVRGFDRPNIWLGVHSFSKEGEQKEALLTEVSRAAGPGIVYVATRRHAEEISGSLASRGVRAPFYHAGMRKTDRQDAQTAFISGAKPVIVATSAFGMGIDKPDVRFVFHYDVSDSLDSYYQEIGRAGRDGANARALLFYRAADANLHRFFAGKGRVAADDVGDVAELLQTGETWDSRELATRTGLSRAKVTSAILGLEDLGALEFLPDGRVRRGRIEPLAAADDAVGFRQRSREAALARLESIREYAETGGCRRQFLLEYFGETLPHPCGFCDNCETAGRGGAESSRT